MAVIAISGDRQWGASRAVFDDLLEEIAARVGDPRLARKLTLAVEANYGAFDLADLTGEQRAVFEAALVATIAARMSDARAGEDVFSRVATLLEDLRLALVETAPRELGGSE